jgi:predicted nuclease of predicted toxin-antitoxin system
VKFKTDENVHPDLAARLRADGHDAVTVWDQSMRGRPDADLASVCLAEGRALVTFDKGFADIRTYPPDLYSGLIVLRLDRQSRSRLLAAWDGVADLLVRERLIGKLWIVDEDGVRIRPGDEPTPA